MAHVEKSVLVMHACEDMYQLVDAVENYPTFLPWCGGVDLHERTASITKATLHIHYHGLRQKFTTLNAKTYPYRMDISLVDGPFKHLQGHWLFTALQSNACKIEFRLEYEFSSPFLEKIIAPVFSHIANTFVDSFVSIADKQLK